MANRQSTLNCNYWKNQLQALILINDNIDLKTDFGRLSHMSVSRVLFGCVKEVHSFQPNRQKGTRH